MRRTRFKPQIKKNQSFTLNITSMTDMFTILLVFLLQTFASAEVQIDPIESLRLPSSNSEKNPIDGVKISLTQDKLLIDTTILAQLKNNEFEASAIDSNDSNFIKPLFTALQQLNNRLVHTTGSNKDVKDAALKPGKILFQADQELPYSTLRKVMYTASMAGFPNLKMVTVAGN